MEAPCPEIEVFDDLTQDRSTSMTDQAISPLRRRMIEDMTIRKFVAKTQHDYVQRVKDFAVFLGRSPSTASKEDASFSVASGIERRRHAQDECHRGGAALLFQCDARSARPRQAGLVRARAAQSAGGVEPRGGCAVSGGGTWDQVQSRVECRLWCRTACLRGRRAEGDRHRLRQCSPKRCARASTPSLILVARSPRAATRPPDRALQRPPSTNAISLLARQYSTRSAQSPIATGPRPTAPTRPRLPRHTSRGFLPWRFSDRRPGRRRTSAATSCTGRLPKTFT